MTAEIESTVLSAISMRAAHRLYDCELPPEKTPILRRNETSSGHQRIHVHAIRLFQAVTNHLAAICWPRANICT